jgi:hypothetical protein
MPPIPMHVLDPQSLPFIPSFQHQQSQPPQPFFQSDMQQFNPMMFGGYNGAPPFAPYDLPPPSSPYGGYPIGPMDPRMFMNYGQQQLPMQMQQIPMGAGQFPPPPYIHHQSPPIRPQQTTSPNQPTNKATLQFVPSQVFRNMPKKS